MIQQTRFGTSKTVRGNFDAVVENTKQALSDQSFRIVSEVDLAPHLPERSSRRCTVLGAWNILASDALEREPVVGAILPCSIVVYEDDAGSCVVSTVDPCNALDFFGPDLLVERTVLDSRDKLQRAIESVRTQS